MAWPSSPFARSSALDIAPTNATAIVQGFGNVGSHAALGLAARGVKVIGVSDHSVAYYDPKGFDVKALVAHAGETASSPAIRARPRSIRALCSSSPATCSRHARSSG